MRQAEQRPGDRWGLLADTLRGADLPASRRSRAGATGCATSRSSPSCWSA
ncbi:MAG: hypothetical protein MZW92_24610 [Comamonadaceae bacterium]|nr:hypothetical protein [Comamonadaceae bacterium]